MCKTHRPPGVPFDLRPDDADAGLVGLRPHAVQLDAIQVCIRRRVLELRGEEMTHGRSMHTTM